MNKTLHAYRTLLNRDFCFLWIANFFSIFAQRMTNTVLSLYVDSVGANGTLVGVVFSAFTITSLCLLPFSGQIMNHFSKKKLTAASSFVIAFATLGFSFSDEVKMLVMFRLIQGCGLAFYGIGCLTLVSYSVKESGLSLAIAYYAVSTTVAQAIGPGSGLYLSERVGYIKTIQISAFFIFVSSLLLMGIKKDFSKSYQFRLSLKNMWAIEAKNYGILLILVSMANITISSFLILFAYEHKIENASLFFLVNAIALVLIRPVADYLEMHLGNIKTLKVSLIILIISFVFLGFSENFQMLMLSAVGNAFGYGIAFPLIESLSIHSVAWERKALANTTSQIGSNIGILIGPILAGAIKDVFGYRIMFIFQSIYIGAALCLVKIVEKKQIPKK